MKRRGTSLVELCLALLLLGMTLPYLIRPRRPARPPEDRLAQAMEWILHDVATASAPKKPAPPLSGRASRALSELELRKPAGEIRYRLLPGGLERSVRGRGQRRWIRNWLVPAEQARFQVRRLLGPDLVIRVRLIRGRDLLLSAAVVGSALTESSR